MREIAQENYINFGIFLLFWAYLGFRARYTHLAYDAPILSYFDNASACAMLEHVIYECATVWARVDAITHNNVWEQSQLEISPFRWAHSFFSLSESSVHVFTYSCLFPNDSTRFGSFQIYTTYIFMANAYGYACTMRFVPFYDPDNIVLFPYVSHK